MFFPFKRNGTEETVPFKFLLNTLCKKAYSIFSFHCLSIKYWLSYLKKHFLEQMSPDFF